MKPGGAHMSSVPPGSATLVRSMICALPEPLQAVAMKCSSSNTFTSWQLPPPPTENLRSWRTREFSGWSIGTSTTSVKPLPSGLVKAGQVSPHCGCAVLPPLVPMTNSLFETSSKYLVIVCVLPHIGTPLISRGFAGSLMSRTVTPRIVTPVEPMTSSSTRLVTSPVVFVTRERADVDRRERAREDHVEARVAEAR